MTSFDSDRQIPRTSAIGKIPNSVKARISQISGKHPQPVTPGRAAPIHPPEDYRHPRHPLPGEGDAFARHPRPASAGPAYAESVCGNADSIAKTRPHLRKKAKPAG